MKGSNLFFFPLVGVWVRLTRLMKYDGGMIPREGAFCLPGAGSLNHLISYLSPWRLIPRAFFN